MSSPPEGVKARICVLTQQLARPVSGIGLHASNLVGSLAVDGYPVTVIAPADERPEGELPYPFIPIPPPALRASQARWLSASANFARRLAKLEGQFDLLHFTDAREAYFYRGKTLVVGNANDTYSAKVEPLAYYRRYFNDALPRWAYYRLVHAFEARVFPRLGAILANSQFTRQTLLDSYRLRPERVQVVHKSVDASRFASALDLRRWLKDPPPRVLFVGGNMQRKGLPTLIEAAAEVIQAIPAAEFWVVGRDAAEPQMRALCARRGVAERFQFMGWKPQADLPGIYAQSAVFAMPSLVEAFGVVFLEAMAAGVPVIGSAVGGIPEIITAGENGLLVPPGNASALAAAIIQVLSDPDLQERLRQAGLATARQFSVERMMAETYAVYARMLGGT